MACSLPQHVGSPGPPLSLSHSMSGNLVDSTSKEISRILPLDTLSTAMTMVRVPLLCYCRGLWTRVAALSTRVILSTAAKGFFYNVSDQVPSGSKDAHFHRVKAEGLTTACMTYQDLSVPCKAFLLSSATQPHQPCPFTNTQAHLPQDPCSRTFSRGARSPECPWTPRLLQVYSSPFSPKPAPLRL